MFSDLSSDEADALGLVLASERIPYAFIREFPGHFHIEIDDADKDRALHAVALYLEENIEEEKHDAFLEKFNKTTSGLFTSILLLFIHIRTDYPSYHNEIVSRYGASAELILKGQIYRCLTALFLHGDAMHLLGNMASVALFCTAVAGIMGIGIGWFLIVLSGVMGNGLNALFYRSHHMSIGSSTGIFGAIGILAAYRSTRLIKEKGFHTKALLPMGAGITFLALLGSSEHSDITAHLFGYISGAVLGTFYSLNVKSPLSEWVQYLFLAVTVTVIAVSWYSPVLFNVLP